MLLSDRSESIHMSGSEVRLYTPVNWSELYNALHRSWQDLHLISGTLAKSDSAGQESSVKKSKILLVGSHVASRELFRLSLEKWPVSIDIAGNISELQNCKTVYKYAAVFFDFPYLSSEELLSFLQNRNKKFPDCFLLCDKQPADLWQSCVDNYLIKPVSDEKLAVVLHPLLAAQSTLQLHEGDNR